MERQEGVDSNDLTRAHTLGIKKSDNAFTPKTCIWKTTFPFFSFFWSSKILHRHGMKSSCHHHLLKKCSMVKSRAEPKNPSHTPFGTGSCRVFIRLVLVFHFLLGLMPRKEMRSSFSFVSLVICFSSTNSCLDTRTPPSHPRHVFCVKRRVPARVSFCLLRG